MVRKFLRKTFPLILDILFIVSAICVVIVAITASFVGGFTSFLISLIAGSVTLVMSFGTINILLDIRDALEKNNANNANNVVSEEKDI